MRLPLFTALALAAASPASGAADARETCLLRALQSAAGSVTVRELRQLCERVYTREDLLALDEAFPETPADTIEGALEEEAVRAEGERPTGVVERRMELERYTRDNPFVLTPHRPNFAMPLVYTTSPNGDASDSKRNDLDNIEFQFQLSLKAVLIDNLFGRDSYLSVAYTNRSFWQAYNEDISRSFRETNHEPELILTLENDWEILGFRNVANQLILNHQSNGRGGLESRSWNRVMANFIFERENLALSFKPWWRIPEDDKDDPLDPKGDDNPDIERYLGHFELLGGWQWRDHNFTLMWRNNLRSDNKGAAELSWSFPIGGRVRGLVRYFNGYGESLIDYDQSVSSIGVGVLFTDWF